MSRIGATDPIEFLLMAIDGMEARLNGFQNQLAAIRQTAEGIAGANHRPQNSQPLGLLAAPPASQEPAKRRGRPPQVADAAPAAPKPAEPAKRHAGYEWTPAMRRAAAKRAKAMWKKGKFRPQAAKPPRKPKPTVKLDRMGKPFQQGAHGWTPEAKAKLSAAMKAAHREKKLTGKAWKAAGVLVATGEESVMSATG